MRKPPSQAKLQAEVDAFNTRIKKGDMVSVKKDNGDRVDTFTESEAYILSGHTAVVMLQGFPACYLLSRVNKL